MKAKYNFILFFIIKYKDTKFNLIFDLKNIL
jgi:hypothetical protein